MEAKDQSCRDREGAVSDAAVADQPAGETTAPSEQNRDGDGAAAEIAGAPDEPADAAAQEPCPDEPCRDEGAVADAADADTAGASNEPADPITAESEPVEPTDTESFHDTEAPVMDTADAQETVAEPTDDSTSEPEQPTLPPEDDPELRAVVEAIVYVTEEPVTPAQIAAVVKRPESAVRKVLDALAATCASPERGITVREIAGGYKMATKPEHHEILRAFAKSLKPPLKLSLAALETLATIAYKQPITAPEIMEIRGVQGAGVLKTLLDRKLIQTAGRKNVVGKPILYRTTREFLVQFGLKDVSELPTLKEFEELRRIAVAEPEGESESAAGTSSEQSELPIEEATEELQPADGETGPAPDVQTEEPSDAAARQSGEQAGAAPVPESDTEPASDEPPVAVAEQGDEQAGTAPVSEGGAEATSHEPPATSRERSEQDEQAGAASVPENDTEPATDEPSAAVGEQGDEQAGTAPVSEGDAEATSHEPPATSRERSEQDEQAGAAPVFEGNAEPASDEPPAAVAEQSDHQAESAPVSEGEADTDAETEATGHEPRATTRERSEQDPGTPSEDPGQRRGDEPAQS